MKSLIQMLVLAAFVLSGSLVPAVAGDAPKGAEKDASGNIKLKENEIKGTLKDIVGSLNLNQTEISGNLATTSITYNRPWSRPEPFPQESEDLSRDLIDQAYAPVDRDFLTQQVEIISGPGQDGGSAPPSGFASGENDLSSFISFASQKY